GFKANQMRPTFVRVDIVGEGKNLFLISVVVLQGYLEIDPFFDSPKIDNFVMEMGLILVEMFHERNDASHVVEVMSLLRSLVLNGNEQPFVQEREFSEPLR